MHKIALIVLSLLTVPALLSAQETTREVYLSPGVSLGYTFGDGFTWGGQLSVGTFRFQEGDGLAWGNVKGTVVGLTAGYRWSKLRTVRYLDAQVSAGEEPLLFFFPGVGVGLAWASSTDHSDVQRYTHLKGWGWALGVLQADYFFNSSASFYSVSGAAVLPLPVSRLFSEKETTDNN
jgi:hypothetical protein